MVMIDKVQELKFLISTYEPWGHNYRGPLVLDAVRFAYEAHQGQTRKYTGEPYIYHPLEVMQIVEITTHGTWPQPVRERAMCAALLHDVVEDTPRTLADVDAHFGTVVSQWVAGLTAPSRPQDGNRAARVKIDIDHLREQNDYVHTIKCADIISNVKDFAVVCTDKKFAKQYIEEKWEAVRACTGALSAAQCIAQTVVATARKDLCA